jgi:type I restriction enzyme M protein
VTFFLLNGLLKCLSPEEGLLLVLPQGKFNNSSLAFIREWILRKARLLAVVGLHGNTFKPHTGTKTSVLFIQKYSEKELTNIEKVQNEVKASCPDYGKQIGQIIDSHKEETDIPDENIPENILELLMEEFSQPEKEADEEFVKNETKNTEDMEPEIELPDLLEKAKARIILLRTELINTKQQLAGLEDELEALQNKQNTEINLLLEKKIDKEELNKIKEEHKLQNKELKEQHKVKIKSLKSSIKQLESDIPVAEYEKNILTSKGKLQIVLVDEDFIQRLSDRYIDAEVARRLDYPIFMAVSERGGKNKSGEYEFLTDGGNITQDINGNPVYNQDLVNYSITKASLLGTSEEKTEYDAAAEYISYSVAPGIAESFVTYAKEQELNFWKD